MATTVTTAFTGRFWSPAELVRTAVARGYQSVGLADIGGFFGAVEFYRNAQQHGIEPILGCRLWCHQCGWLQFTVRTRHGYRKLNELLTCTAGEVLASPDHLKRILSEAGDDFWVSLSLLRPCAPFPGISPPEALVPWWMRNWNWLLNHAPAENCWLELGWRDEYERSAQRRVYQQLAHAGWDRWVIMSHARMADTADSWRLELTQSIGTLTRVAQEHPAKLSPGEDSLAYAEVMAQRWSKVPSVLESTRRFASGCAFEMELGRLHLPGWDADGDNIPDAHQANARLAWLCLRGLVRRYRKEPYPWPDKPESSALLQRLQRELNVVREVGFAGYFLIFHAIVEQCRRRQIPLLARGSAAGSLICHALGVSNVCPFRFGLSFERFLNLDRMRHSKLPDIDLDLPWDQRDEILEWMYQHFGPERVAMIGGFSTYQARGALAEVAKAMGLPAARAHELSKRLPHGALHRFISRAEHYVEAAPVLEDAENNRMLAAAVALDGLPRHPMMHPCGAVIADRKLTHFLPLQSSAKGLHMTQFDMHAVEETGLLKLDLLGQAGLSVLRDVEQNLCSEGVANPWAGLDLRRPELYHACARGDVRGIFHIESPAMIGLQRLCRCADMDCLVAVVSVIRPGAANEDKKLHFARRYLGLEPPEYAHPVLRDVLGDTYGLLVYEEQILFVAHKFAGLDYGTADKLRRLLIKQKDADELEQMGTVFEQRAALIGRQPQEINTVWHALRAFSGFMFNKAHGAAYAMEAARGLWLKQHWPIHFLAGVLNNRRGFYQPLVYVIEIIRAGGQLRLPDINASEQKFAACGRHVSIPLWQIKGLRQEFSAQWRKARQAGPFGSWEDFVQRVRPDPADAQLLAKSGALDVFFRNRHEAVWRAGQIARTPMKKREQEYSLWDQYSNVAKAKAAPSLPPCTDSIKAEWEASLLGFPVTVDPFQLWLPPASDPGCIAVVELENHIGREVEIRGIVVATRSHHTLQGKLMKFISLADPSGIAECTLFPDVYRRYGAICYGARWLQCRVQVERDATDSGIQLQVIAATQHTSMDPFLLSAV